jgi:hypothetical protein
MPRPYWHKVERFMQMLTHERGKVVALRWFEARSVTIKIKADPFLRQPPQYRPSLFIPFPRWLEIKAHIRHWLATLGAKCDGFSGEFSPLRNMPFKEMCPPEHLSAPETGPVWLIGSIMYIPAHDLFSSICWGQRPASPAGGSERSPL